MMHDTGHVSDHHLVTRNEIVTPDDLVNQSIPNTSESPEYKNEPSQIFVWNRTGDVVVSIDQVQDKTNMTSVSDVSGIGNEK